jgi:Flp pilus assembly protein TadD
MKKTKEMMDATHKRHEKQPVDLRELSEDEADDIQVRDNSAFMEGSWGTDPRGRLIEQ